MTAEIIIPIKCSTVKTWVKQLDYIADIEVHVVGLSMFLWSISVFYKNTYSPLTSLGEGMLACVGMLIGFIVFRITLVEGLPYLYNLLPSIGCIKDDPPQERDNSSREE